MFQMSTKSFTGMTRMKVPREGEKEMESSTVGNAKCLELASIIRSWGYSQISHTIRDKEDQSKIIGYALFLEDVNMGEDLEEFFVIPVEEANYLRVETDIADDLTDIAEKQVIESYTVSGDEAPSNSVIETDDVIEMEADISD